MTLYSDRDTEIYPVVLSKAERDSVNVRYFEMLEALHRNLKA